MRNCLLCGTLAPRPGRPRPQSEPPDPAGNPPPEPTPVVRLAVKPGRPERRALKYTLLPDPLDLTPGNAAPLWVRAGDRLRRRRD